MNIVFDSAQTSRLRLRWPVGAAGYALESTGSLDAPAWNAVNETVRVDAGNVEATIEITGAARYFRLRR